MKVYRSMKTIKMIGTKNFCIELVQLGDSRYVVGYEANGIAKVSEPMKDYKTASYMFDVKLQDLEGN